MQWPRPKVEVCFARSAFSSLFGKMSFYDEDDPAWEGVEQWYDFGRPGDEVEVPEFLKALLIAGSFVAYFALTLGGLGR